MRASLLLGAMLLLFALVSAVPLPEFVTMVVTEIHTVVQRRRSSPKFLSTISSTIPPTITSTSTTSLIASSIYSTSLDPYAEIMSLLALLTPPASISSLTSTGAPGMAGVQALASYVEEIANSSWLATVASSDFSYESSEARIAASIMPAIVSLGAVELTILLSEQALVTSSLGAAEGSLSSKVFTTISTAFGTETAVVTEPLLVPIVTHQESKLTPGQKTGLGIGIPAFVLMALGIGFVVFHVRRNRIRSQEAAFLQMQPTEKRLKRLDPQPEGSAIGLRSSGASFSNDNIAASTLAGDLPRPQSYHGASYEDSVENRRVQSIHGGLSRRSSTGRPLDIDRATHEKDAQASHALDLFCHAYGGLQPSEAAIQGHPTDNLHAMLPIAHELPATPLNTRLPSPVSQQHTQEGVPTGSDLHESGIQASMDTESEASMENWREAVAEPENAYDGDDDEAEHSEGIGRAT